MYQPHKIMTARQNKNKPTVKPMPFAAFNYKLMALGVLLVITGFTAMYLENEVRGFISLYVSPIVILTGYLTVVVAILKRSNTHLSSE